MKVILKTPSKFHPFDKTPGTEGCFVVYDRYGTQ